MKGWRSAVLHAIRLIPTPRLARVLLPLLALGLLGGCGLAESIGESFVDDELVTLQHRLDRSGTVVCTADGTELEALPAVLYVGDAAVDAHGVCVFGFAIDPSLQPSNTEIDRATLRIWMAPESGAPESLGPLVVSHLVGHPDALLATGQLPHPLEGEVGTLTSPFAAGWRDVDVTSAFLQDWNAGRSISAFAVRLSTATNGDGQADTLTFDGTDGSGQTVTTHLILRFSLDL